MRRLNVDGSLEFNPGPSTWSESALMHAIPNRNFNAGGPDCERFEDLGYLAGGSRFDLKIFPSPPLLHATAITASSTTKSATIANSVNSRVGPPNKQQPS